MDLISLFFSIYLTFFQIQLDLPIVQSETLKEKGKVALQFCKQHKLNTDFCILIDMRTHSGRKRFFVWDMQRQTVLDAGLCSHGCCDKKWGIDLTKNNPIFSNTPESHCSSLGKYKIGVRDYSQWGINVNYKLHGLERSNNNAFIRQIVLHSWKKVSDKDVFPKGTPEGWGCPAISNNFMRRLDKRLKNSAPPALLWIFN